MSSLENVSFAVATQNRRSMRALEATSPVPDSTIVRLVETALLNVPSAFNSQTTRITILFGDDHRKLWTMTEGMFKNKLGEQRFESSHSGMPSFKQKIEGYHKAHGTVLFWDDSLSVKGLKETSSDIYKDKIEEWAHQSNGMHQYYLWTALEAFGLGVNLQHYNPLIDESVRKAWNQPTEWLLRAQMVFGTPTKGSQLAEKVQRMAMESRLHVFGENTDAPMVDHL